MTKSICNLKETHQRRFRLFGHVFRRPAKNIIRTALRWTPWGERPSGRTKIIWHRTIEAEMKEFAMTWGEAETKAKDMQNYMATLCSVQSEEEKSPRISNQK